MKKFLCLITVLLLVFCFVGCEGVPEIENYEWKLRSAWRSSDGKIEAVAKEEELGLYPDAEVVSVALTAKYGNITITDETNGTIYTGTYKVSQRTPAGTDYSIVIDGITGHATVAMTTYADGSGEPTLPINIGGYSLYFYGK